MVTLAFGEGGSGGGGGLLQWYTAILMPMGVGEQCHAMQPTSDHGLGVW